MNANLPRRLALLGLGLLCGCSSPQPAPVKMMDLKAVPSRQKPADPRMHDNALNLLHDLLGDEKNVSKILFIKRVSPDVKRLVKDIATTADAGLKTVEYLAPTNTASDWKRLDLPPGETAVRAAMAKSKEHDLLHASGGEFEFLLLLTQSEALSYGTHLARIAAENESDPLPARQLASISNDLNQLHADVLRWLRAHRQLSVPSGMGEGTNH